MNTKKNEFIIGLTMSLATLIVIVGILILGKSNFFVSGLPINLIVDNAYGIGEGDEVYFRGVKVGTVNNTEISDNRVLLKLKIENINKIPVDSKFEIKDYSLVGGKIVEISPGKFSVYLHENDTVKGNAGQNNMESLISDVKKLEPKIDRILNNLEALTGNETKTKMELILRELLETITITKRIVNIDLRNTLMDLNEITSQNKERVSELIESLSKSSNNLSDFLVKSSSAAVKLDSLLTKLNQGKGSMGNLIHNDSLYHNLNRTVLSIDSLVSDIKKNPDKYIHVSVF